MSEYEKWEIAAVLPEDFVEFDDWVLHKADLDMNPISAVVYHKHVVASKTTLYMTRDNKCRDCGAEAPPGILFLARVSKLEAFGVTDGS